MFTELAKDFSSIVYDFELIWRKMLLNEKIPYKERLFELLDKSNAIKIDPTISLDKKLVIELEKEIDNRMVTRGWA